MRDYVQALESIPYTSELVMVVASLVLSAVFYLLSPMIMHRVLNYISTETLDFDKSKFVKNSRLAISFTFAFTGGILVIQDKELQFSVDDILTSVMASVLLLLWLRVVHNVGRYAIEKIVKKRYDKSMIPIIENIWTLLTILTTVFVLFDIWDIDITPLLASAGVAGIVLGLAARETISNFFGSIALYADDTYQAGHFIELNNGEIRGYVRDISIRSTQLVTLEGNKVIVPNSKLHDSIIKNKSTPTPDHRAELTIGVSYNTTPREAESVIRRGIENVIEEEEQYDRSWFFGDSEDSYKVFLEEFGGSSVIFKIFIKIEAPQQELALRSKFYHSIYNELKQEGIGLPYPQRSIHFADEVDGEGLADNPSDGDKLTETDVPSGDVFDEKTENENLSDDSEN